MNTTNSESHRGSHQQPRLSISNYDVNNHNQSSMFSIVYYNYFRITAALEDFLLKSAAREHIFIGKLTHQLHMAADPCLEG